MTFSRIVLDDDMDIDEDDMVEVGVQSSIPEEREGHGVGLQEKREKCKDEASNEQRPRVRGREQSIEQGTSTDWQIHTRISVHPHTTVRVCHPTSKSNTNHSNQQMNNLSRTPYVLTHCSITAP